MKKSVTEKLDEVLGIAESLVVDVPVEEETTTEQTAVDVPEQSLVEVVTPEIVVPEEQPSDAKIQLLELDEDIRETRKVLKFLVETGKTSLEELQMLATETEEPRPYEVLSELIKSIAEVSKELITLHKMRADIVKINNDVSNANRKDSPTSLTQNQTNVFLNTTDLVKMLREGNQNADTVLPEQSSS